jgi:hypothetical protein
MYKDRGAQVLDGHSFRGHSALAVTKCDGEDSFLMSLLGEAFVIASGWAWKNFTQGFS